MKKKSENLKIFCLGDKNNNWGKYLKNKQIDYLKTIGFSGAKGELVPLSDGKGDFYAYAFGMGHKENNSPLIIGLASAKLNSGKYQLKGTIENPALASLGFELGAYVFDEYKKSSKNIELDYSKEVDVNEVKRLAKAAFIARDLINAPPNILGPNGFDEEVQKFAKQNKMQIKVIIGDELLKQNFPMIHAVGRASSQAPRLLDLRWGKNSDPKVTLVGKGVTFDSGGLDIKHASGMMLMKKDMGGAANVLGLAHAIIDAKLKVNLRVLLPIVENAISSNAFRPGDILPSRLGLNVEIGNTDAEGRLILADALALADEESPEIIIDMATLTGAARIALGPDLPPLYCDDDKLVQEMLKAGKYWGDELWHMPLYQP
ncbi:MAG: leucyl aminopeptidase family protein [Devosiaceae bacterium]|nr:leucyl aminopeptidase family protein [Devosiaceae bacterium]